MVAKGLGRLLMHSINLIALFTLIIPVEIECAQFLCPSYAPLNERVSSPPCNCKNISGPNGTVVYDRIECYGPKVTQDTIDRFISDLRTLNKVQAGTVLKIPYNFYIFQADSLKILNLSAFFKTEFLKLKIGANYNLNVITGGNMTPTIGDGVGSIGIVDLDIWQNFGVLPGAIKAVDTGMQNMLKFFNPKTIRHVNLVTAYMRRTEQSVRQDEFITGLFSLTELETLNVGNNSLVRLRGGQFRKLSKLKKLYLDRGNLQEIGADAFTFDGPPTKTFVNATNNDILRIDLEKNYLTDSKISPTAFTGIKRPSSISLVNNKLETVSADKFKTFLLNHKKNMIVLTGNKITCDKKMQWLRDLRSTLEGRVIGAKCLNDALGNDIFKTNITLQ